MNAQNSFIPPVYVVQQPIGPNVVPLPAPYWIYNPPQQNVYPYPPLINVYGQPQNLNHFPSLPPPMLLPQPYSNLVPPYSNLVPPHPNLVPQHPNLVLPHPNLVPSHPNLVPQYLNLVPPHPNLVPPHPNLLPPHPNIVLPHPNLVRPHANLVLPHPNLMPPQSNVVRPNSNVLPPHSNVVPPHTNNVPPRPHFVPQLKLHNIPPPCGQILQPTRENLSNVKMQPLQQGPLLMPHNTRLNGFHNGQKVTNLESTNNDVSPLSEQPQLESPSKQHVYMHGTLYNTEILKSLESPMNGSDIKLDSSDEEAYNPFDDPLPAIYGIRFYNPNYGPEGAIPKRPDIGKKEINRKLKKSEFFANIAARFHNDKTLYSINNNTSDLESFEFNQGMTRTNKRNQAIRLEADTIPLTKANNVAQNSPKAKGKQHRRQGRNRSRGFTQSFGIVAPGKRSAQNGNENVNAKNVFSIFDKN